MKSCNTVCLVDVRGVKWKKRKREKGKRKKRRERRQAKRKHEKGVSVRKAHFYEHLRTKLSAHKRTLLLNYYLADLSI